MPRRFKRVVRAIDSSTIELIYKCMDWAKHRKRKAAAKLHMSLNALSQRGGLCVTRAKEHARFKVIRERKSDKPKNSISNEEVELGGKVSHKRNSQTLRLICALIKYSKGEEKTITFEGQLWSAMLVYLLLRILTWQGKWKSDFRHFFTFIKGGLWCQRDVLRLISDYGAARGHLSLFPPKSFKPYFSKYYLTSPCLYG